MCGIYGCSIKAGVSKNGMRIALQKIKILGLYNEDRGKDSCGLLINNVVKKGIQATKLFKNFIETETFEVNARNRVMLGHNRQASFGSSVNVDNAHPFLIDDDMFITHNGTLKETLEFCKKYDLPWKDINVDTIMLGMALYRNNPSVLENYKGAAALAYTYRSKPNTLYLYHGASRSTKDGVEVEERPLYFMETAEGVYYSSLDSALLAIRETDDEISYKLEYNTVFEIKDGVFTNNAVKINRGDINVEPVRTYNSGRGTNWNRHYGHYGGYGYDPTYLPFSDVIKGTPKTTADKEFSIIRGTKPVDRIISLSRETLPARVIGEKGTTYAYYFRGRHWIHNPHTADVLADGILWITDTKGYIVKDEARSTAKMFYFYKGNMLKDKEAYEHLKESFDTKTALDNANSNYAQILSKFTMYPIFDVEYVSRSNYKWYKDEKIANGPFTPKFSKRTYRITEGWLDGISSDEKGLCYYSDVTKAEAEYQMYITGELTNIIGQHFSPEDESTLGRMGFSAKLAKKDDSGLEFYEKVFDNEEQAIKAIGKVEQIALDTYSKWFLDEDRAWKFNDQDVMDKTKQVIKEAITNSITIEEVIGEADGIAVLKLKYKELGEDMFMQEHLESSKVTMVDDIDVINHDRPDDRSFDAHINRYDDIQRVVRLVEDVFDHMEELFNNAGDLEQMNIQEANEMAWKIYRMIDEFRVHCQSSEMFKISEFNEFFEKMNKLQKNGAV